MNFTVYKSSAGSGKTFTLVKEYLTLVLSDPTSFSSILAITFTNKAATEMKERIISNLKDLSAVPHNPESKAIKNLLPVLLEETGMTTEEISLKASSILKLILHHYSDFAVSTIDSFSHRIIRSFAFDLRIPMNFEVDTDDVSILEQAVNLLIDKTGSDAQITKTLVEFTESKTEDEKSWNIEDDIYNFSKILLQEESLENISYLSHLTPADFENIRSILGKKIHWFEDQISEFGRKASEIIKSHGIDINDLYHGKTGIGKYFEYLEAKRMKMIEPNSYVKATVHEDRWYPKKIEEQKRAAIDQAKHDILAAYTVIEEFIAEHYPDYIIQEMIYKNAYSMAVLNEIKKITEEIRKEKNIVSVSEFNKRISEVVQHEPVPFIYERTGEKYKNYMIDEFQDTSVMQWQNLLPLVDNSLSEGHRTMVVGDGKQAIYRFRNGEAGQFISLPTIYNATAFSKEREQSLVRNYEEKFLASNYRSKTEIVDFNNRFFSYVHSQLSKENQKIYSGVEQKSDIKNTGGYIQIQFLSDDKEKDNKISYPEEIEKLIREVISEQYRFSDIAILCRYNKHASEVASYLIERNIPVISSESVLLSNSADVRFIISFFKHLIHPEDKIACSEVLYFLANKKLIRPTDFNELLLELKKQSTGTGHFISQLLVENGIHLQFDFLKSLPLYEQTEEIVRLFKLNKDANIYLPSFLDELLVFAKQNTESADEFLAHWEANKGKISVKIPEGSDAIQVMSIHKAKGLEFPVIIYPYLEEKLKNTKDNLWIDPEIRDLPLLKKALVSSSKELNKTKFAEQYEEEWDKSQLDLINLMYVAMTRPTERLYMLSRYKESASSDMESSQGIITGFLQNSEHWDENTKIFTFGKKQDHIKKSDVSSLSTFDLTSMHSDDWRKRIILRMKAPDIWNVDEPEKNKDWGNLVHYALSKIKDINDIENIINMIEAEGLLQGDQKDNLSKLLHSCLSDSVVSAFFKPGLLIKTESEILDNDGKTLRPDRIIIDGDKVIIIDYKTGKPNETHHQQMEIYAGAIEKMGFKNIEKYILYIEENKILCV